MIPKYLATLAVAVFLVTVPASRLQFATRSQVLAGNAVDEALQFEFTIDADSSHTYEISPRIEQFLDDRIGFYTEGSAHVVSSQITITPKDVSWTENRSTITSTGAAMAAQLRWDTPADSPDGTHGAIYLRFPEVPGLEKRTVSFHSGAYQKDGKGRYVIREVTTYRNAFQLSIARFVFAITAALPFAIVLHAIFWGFVLKGEKRSRIAAFPPQGAGLPRTFYPEPVTEWGVWLFVLGIVALTACLGAGISISHGFLSSTIISVIYSMLAIAAALGFTAAYFTRRSLLTVRVDTGGISYAHGRGNLQWRNAAWSEILLFAEQSRAHRGYTSYWIEVEFNDNRKKLKIGHAIREYAALRDILMSMLAARPNQPAGPLQRASAYRKGPLGIT